MKDLPFPLVVPLEGEARASSEIIANGVGQGHRGLMQLIRNHINDFEQFGKVQFDVRLNRRGSPTEFAMLNEPQATLLMTFLRNSPKVVQFKVAIVKEFFCMRDELGRREQNLWQQMQALIAREVESQVRASFGSHLLHERKREIPQFDAERSLLERQIQPSLLPH